MGIDKETKPNLSGTANQQGGGDSNNNDHRAGGGGNHCNLRQRWRQRGHQGGGTFKGKTKEIKNNIFDNTGPHNAAIFNKSLKNIANYLQLQHANNVSKAVCNMTPAMIKFPCHSHTHHQLIQSQPDHPGFQSWHIFMEACAHQGGGLVAEK